MAFSGGVFTLVAGNPVVTGTTIASSWANNTLSDIATALSTCLLKDGTQTVTANIPMAGFKFTGLGTGSAAGNSIRYEQLFTTTALVDAATISWDASLAPVATVTITANRTIAAPTGLKAGGIYGLIVTQDGTGGWTLTWNAVFKAFGGGTMPQPETTLSTSTAFVFYSDGSNLFSLQCTPFVDTNYLVRGSADATKKLRFEVDGFTTATTRVIVPPDANLTIPAVTAKGDLMSASSAGVLVTTAVGADGKILSASAAASGGVAWINPGGMVFLNSGSASGATLDILMTGAAYTAYRTKKLILSSFIPVTNSPFLGLRVSTDGGASYDAGGGAYSYSYNAVDSAGTAAATGGTDTNIRLSGTSVGNGSFGGISLEITLYDTTNTAVWPRLSYHASYVDSGGTLAVHVVGGGARGTPQDTDAIRLLFSSGSITSGTWVLYGSS